MGVSGSEFRVGSAELGLRVYHTVSRSTVKHCLQSPTCLVIEIGTLKPHSEQLDPCVGTCFQDSRVTLSPKPCIRCVEALGVVISRWSGCPENLATNIIISFYELLNIRLRKEY